MLYMVPDRPFVLSESSEKFPHMLCLNVHSSSEVNFFTGDKVYKRITSNTWSEAVVVLGQTDKFQANMGAFMSEYTKVG